MGIEHMSRAIKFRTWGVDGKVGPRMWDWEHIAGCLCMWFEDKTAIIMQFTGLKDKNGREIYEGDIIQCNPEVKYYRVVVWGHDGNYWMVNPDRIMGWEIQCVISSHTDAVVIGNIYENPELLGAE